MWTELKFAVNWRAGDTKPIHPNRAGSRWLPDPPTPPRSTKSRSRSRSMLSKSNAESLNRFGLAGDDPKAEKVRSLLSRSLHQPFPTQESNYDCFDENAYGESLK